MECYSPAWPVELFILKSPTPLTQTHVSMLWDSSLVEEDKLNILGQIMGRILLAFRESWEMPSQHWTNIGSEELCFKTAAIKLLSFNSPGASHHGGVWERLIRSVRQVLHSVLKQQTLDDEGLQTLLCEVEAILNSRPITSVSIDPQDLEPLTPNHILVLKTKPVQPPGLFDRNDLYIRRRWRQVQYMADLFWKRWSQEYLPLMQERQKWCKVRRSFTPGDVVLVVDPSAPRGSYILGKVLEVLADSKGLVWAAKVKTHTSVPERPITKICLLLECKE